jgi:hypothetical protein
VTLTFTVHAGSGQVFVSDTAVKQDGLNDSGLTDCLTKGMNEVVFPAPPDQGDGEHAVMFHFNVP